MRTPAALLALLGVCCLLHVAVAWNLTVIPGSRISGLLSCTPLNHLSEASLRSADERGLTLAIGGGLLVATPPLNAAVMVNMHLRSRSRRLAVETIEFITSRVPNLLSIIFVQRTDYDIAVNDTATLYINHTFFAGNRACPPVRFAVRPLPGQLNGSSAPAFITEISINTADVSFTVDISEDEFAHAALPVVFAPSQPSGLAVSTALVNGSTRQLTITFLRNETFNIRNNETFTATFFFTRGVVRSGRPPSFNDGVHTGTSLVVSITGSRPLVLVSYDEAVDGVRGITSEAMWDGRGRVHLQLVGDSWVQDPGLWLSEDFGPTYAVLQPTQAFGMEFCLRTSARPNVTLSPKVATLLFPPCVGFTLSTAAAQEVQMTRMNKLVTEGEFSLQSISFQTLRVRSTSIVLRFYGTAFEQPPIAENDVRIRGITFGVEVKYNVFSTTLATGDLRPVIIAPIGSSLSAAEINFVHVNLTNLVITLPAQESYDITNNEIINVTMFRTLFAAQLDIPSPTSGFVIRALSGTVTPTCSAPAVDLNERMVRSNDNLTFTVVISGGEDEFCWNRTISDATIIPTTREGLLNITLIEKLPRLMRFAIARNPNYDIRREDLIVVTVPPVLMCSLEKCLPKPNTQETLVLSVQRIYGQLFLTLPTVDEAYMRTNTFYAEMYVRGDQFLSSLFRPRFEVVGGDSDRGFAASVMPGVVARRDDANRSRAILEFVGNASYDIRTQETISVVLDAFLLAGALPPVNEITTPLVVTVVPGVVVPSIPARTTIEEDVVTRGGFQFTVELLYDRWNQSVLPRVVQDDIRVVNPITGAPAVVFQRDGMATRKNAIFGDAAFAYDSSGSILTVTLQMGRGYDIQTVEAFTLSFKADTTYSRRPPLNDTITFVVNPTPGSIFANGSALFAPLRSVIAGGLGYTITVRNDLWVSAAEQGKAVLCPVGPCIITTSTDSRELSVTFQPNRNFLVRRNATYRIVLSETFLASNLVPSGTVELLVYVTEGVVSFAPMELQYTEDDVRGGTGPSIRAEVFGDSFVDERSVRDSLVNGVECVSLPAETAGGAPTPAPAPGPPLPPTPTTSVGSGTNRYGFCARAVVLFGGVNFELKPQTDGSPNGPQLLTMAPLQPDGDYDIYEPEVVTIAFTALALASRMAPLRRDSTVSFRVVPTPGRFFISGAFQGLSERVLQTGEGLHASLVFTLHGERWAGNASVAAKMLLAGITSARPLAEPSGFTRYKEEILAPSGAALSTDERVLTLLFLRAPGFDISSDETVNIAMTGAAVRSGIAPILQSATSSFVITATGGVIRSEPATATAQVVRDRGLAVTLQITDGAWDIDVVKVLANLDAAITPLSSPQSEPHGFAVYRTRLVSTLARDVATRVAGKITLYFAPVAEYELREAETVQFTIPQSWTMNPLLPLPTSRFSIVITPDYRFAVASVRVAANTTFNEAEWKMNAAAALGVSASVIEMSDRPIPEPMLPSVGPNGETYVRISFRVRSAVAGPEVRYNNGVTRLFVSLDAPTLQTQFGVVAAFYADAPPSAAFWAAMQPNARQPTPAPPGALDAKWLYLLAGLVAVIVISLAVLAWMRRGRSDGGVKRLRAEDVAKANALKKRLDQAAEADFNADEGRDFQVATAAAVAAATAAAGRRALVGGESNVTAARAAAARVLEEQRFANWASGEHGMGAAYAGQVYTLPTLRGGGQVALMQGTSGALLGVVPVKDASRTVSPLEGTFPPRSTTFETTGDAAATAAAVAAAMPLMSPMGTSGTAAAAAAGAAAAVTQTAPYNEIDIPFLLYAGQANHAAENNARARAREKSSVIDLDAFRKEHPLPVRPQRPLPPPRPTAGSSASQPVAPPPWTPPESHTVYPPHGPRTGFFQPPSRFKLSDI